MKQLLLFLALFTFISASRAQLSWQNPNLTGERMNAIQFVNSTTGWVAGDAGTLLKTIDSGLTWSKIDVGTCDNISTFHFVNANEGWLIGGVDLYHSLNGGITWDLFPILNHNTFSTMSFVSSTSWFLKSSDGLLFTNDNGTTWELKNSSISTVFAFANPRKGWQTAPFGGLKYTTDGGVTWTTQTSGVSENIFDISIIDSNEVWMAGVSGLIHTTNAGTNWNINIPSRTIMGVNLIFSTDCHFRDANLGWAVCPNYEAVIITTDGGATWSRKTVAGTSVFGFDATSGLVIGEQILRTTDGGDTFTDPLHPVTKADLYGVSFANNTNGFSVGATGTILATSDGGTNWNLQSSGTTADLNEVFAISPSEAWIAGNMSDSILHTIDGGSSWQAQASGTTNFLTDIHFVNNQEGWAVGENGTIVHTSNGGLLWNTQVSNTSVTLKSVFFFDQNNGWIVGDQGLILRTIDGGTTWSNAVSGTTNFLNDVYFVSANSGWAVGETTMILHTTDGGLNWSVQPVSVVGELFGLHAVSFVNDQIGWTTGFTPSILFTTDGGTTWDLVDCAPEIRNLYGLCFTDDTHGWMVGERGAVVFSNSAGELSVSDFGNAKAHELIISPNPSAAFITLQSDLVLENIEIRDMNGRLIKQVTGVKDISIAELESGMYYLFASSELGTMSSGFVKE